MAFSTKEIAEDEREITFKDRLLGAEKAFLDIVAELGEGRTLAYCKTRLEEARLLTLHTVLQDG